MGDSSIGDSEIKDSWVEVWRLGIRRSKISYVHPKYGGGGLDAVSYVLALEEICKIEAAVGTIMSVNNSLVCWGIEHFGTEMQKEKYLIPLPKERPLEPFAFPNPRPARMLLPKKQQRSIVVIIIF